MSVKKRRVFSDTASFFTNYISQENATIVAADTFTGEFVYCSQYSLVICSIAADVDGTLSFECSFNGIDVADTTANPVTGGTGLSLRFPIFYPFVRVAWAATIGPTASLNIYTVFTRDPVATSLTTIGGDQDIIIGEDGSVYLLKGLTAGTGMEIVDNGNELVFNNTDGASTVTLVSAGGTEDIVVDGAGPDLAVKGFTAGSGIGVDSITDPNYLILNNTAPDQTVTLIGGLNTSVTGTYPTFTIDTAGGSGVMYMAGMAIGELKKANTAGIFTTTFAGAPGLITPVGMTLTSTKDLTLADFFDSPSNGRLRYVGTQTQDFHCAVSISFETPNATVRWRVEVLKNGVLIPNSSYWYDTKAATDRFDIAFHIVAQLATNDYIEVQLENESGIQEVDVLTFNVVAIGNGDTDAFVNTSLTSAGGTESLVVDGTGPAMTVKGLTPGSNITFTPGPNDITVASNGSGFGARIYANLRKRTTTFHDNGTDMPVVNPTFIEYVNATATYAFVSSAEFTQGTDTRVQYTGSTTRVFRCTLSLDYRVGGGKDLGAAFALNGVIISGTEHYFGHEDAGALVTSATMDCLVNLTTNDVISLYVAANGGVGGQILKVYNIDFNLVAYT